MILKCFMLAIVAAALACAQQAPRAILSTDTRIAEAQRRLKQTPSDAALRNQLASAYLQKMRETADGAYLQRAATLIEDVLKSDPKNYDARRIRIEVALQMHRFKDVVAMTAELAKDRPGDSVVSGLQGDALMELGEYDRAADAYQKMVDLRPGLASYNRIAFYRFVTGDAEGAIEVMRKGIAIGGLPENVAWCLSDLGGMLLKAGSIDEAEAAYRDALARFPGYHHALAGMGRVMAARGSYNEAVQYFLKAQAVAPFPEYSAMLAKLYRQTGKVDQAARQLAMLDVADKLGKAAGEAANRNLALAFADLDHHTARGLEIARAELDIRHDVYTYDALAWSLFKNGAFSEAAVAMRKALAQNTPEPQFREHAARIFEAAAARENPKQTGYRTISQ